MWSTLENVPCWLRRVCILLLWVGMFCIYLLGPPGLLCHSQPPFPYSFSVWKVCPLMWVECWSPYCYCITLSFSPLVCSYLLHVFSCFRLHAYLGLLYQSVESILLSLCNALLCFKSLVCPVQVWLRQIAFFASISIEYLFPSSISLFPSFHFSFVK